MAHNKNKQLSLVSKYDDLIRHSAPLTIGHEDQFLKFVQQEIECRKRMATLKRDNETLKAEVEKLKKDKNKLETKMKHTKYLLGTEADKRKKITAEKQSLERQLLIIKEVLWAEQNTLNEETKEKLAFLEEHQRTTMMQESGGIQLSSSEMSFDPTDEELDSIRTVGEVSRRVRRSRGKRNSSQRNQEHHDLSRSLDIQSEVVDTTTIHEPCSQLGANSCVGMRPERCNSDPMILPSLLAAMPVKHGFVSKSRPIENPKLTREVSLALLRNSRQSLGRKERKHAFVPKTIIRPENCSYCNQKIKFYKQAFKCQDCRLTCHPECRINIKSSCSRTAGARGSDRGGKFSLTDYAYHTSPMVPEIIIQCINEIEIRGLSEPGLYRISGSEKDIRELRDKMLKGHSQSLSHVDIHVVCSMVKEFFRSLDEPLITRTLWSEFSRVAEMSNQEQRIQISCNIIQMLPLPNKETLAFLVMHLNRVAENPLCKMPISNLAKVFGPTIIGYSTADPSDIDALSQTEYQFMIMELLLRIPLDFWKNILPDDEDDTVFSMSTPTAKQSAVGPKENAVSSKGGRTAKRVTHVGRASLTPRTGSGTTCSAAKKKRFFPSPLIK